jgi:hypothetical protein
MAPPVKTFPSELVATTTLRDLTFPAAAALEPGRYLSRLVRPTLVVHD